MMANSSRDPYWQASFTVEVLENPDYQEVIEDKCTTCHTPMARLTAYAEGDTGKAFDDGFLSPANELHTLAMDSVSCTLCHQIRAGNFGQPESYSGSFVIDTELPTGERVTFGPFPVDETQAIIMQGTSGFIPEQSSHVQQSELCGTCHTLYTPYLDATGQIAGEFPGANTLPRMAAQRLPAHPFLPELSHARSPGRGGPFHDWRRAAQPLS